MRTVSGVGRVAAIGAVIAAVVLVAIVLFGSSTATYEAYAEFENAGQLVKGNQVQIGGAAAGTVDDIKLTDDGQARIKFSVDEKYAPLAIGTHAMIRQASQSGIANRYVELQPPTGRSRGHMKSGETITADSTQTAVDLDQLFDTLDKPTRKSLQRFLKGNARLYAGRGAQANAGFYYLNPALATSSKLFAELNKDQPLLEKFIVDSSTLVTDLAEKRDDLTNLVTNLNTTTRALGSQKQALANSIEELPPFMRRANTTFVNLRGALDDTDPLVAASKPVAKKLLPFFAELRPFARDARPTIRNLRLILDRKGRSNDLNEVLRFATPLKNISIDSGQRNGQSRRGAFPEAAQALKDTAPIIAQGRPYTPDLIGWFDDFSTPGNIDAQGGYLRFQIYLNSLSVTPGGALQPLRDLINPPGGGGPLSANVNTNQFRRCPGGAEPPAPDGSNVLSEQERQALDCDEAARAGKGKVK